MANTSEWVSVPVTVTTVSGKPFVIRMAIRDMGIQNGTDRTVYVRWYEANNDYPASGFKYTVKWTYNTGNGVWFDGGSNQYDRTVTNTTYNAPSNATAVNVFVGIDRSTLSDNIVNVNTYGASQTFYFSGYVAPTAKAYMLNLDANAIDSGMCATWEWNKESQTDHFEVQWQYDTGAGVWFEGATNNEPANRRYSLYTPPNNAKKVRYRARPVSKEFTQTNGQSTRTTAYWIGQWTSWIRYEYDWAKTPAKPNTPSVSVNNFVLTAEVDCYDTATKYIEFEVVKDDSKTVKTGQSRVVTNHAAFSCAIDPGGRYKVRARGLLPVADTVRITNRVRTTVGDCEAGEWSEYSSNVSTVPTAPAKIKSHTVLTPTSVQLYWDGVNTATGYTIEFVTDKNFFDSSTEPKSQSVEGVNTMVITGLDTGTTWFFRLRATNSHGGSEWTPVYSIVLGKVPAAPTTWSETSTVIVGEDITFYWMHNSEDGSSQTDAEIEALINGAKYTVYPTHISNDGTASYATFESMTWVEDYLADRNGQHFYVKPPGYSGYGSYLIVNKVTTMDPGSIIQWRVRTKGVLDEWGPWSATRTITIYARPSIDLLVSDRSDLATYIYTLRSYPFYIGAEAFPATQSVIGWNVSITSNEAYMTQDVKGNNKYVKMDEEVYSKYIPAETGNELYSEISASDVLLEDGVTYTVHVRVIMNSGLTAEETARFTVKWEYTNIEPNAEVIVDRVNLSAYIQPYCRDDNDDLVENILLSVYRREYDGRFVEIATDLDNMQGITVTDPHPALDYARYRIVAKSTATGQIDFFDAPGINVGETGIILQWDEDWSNFNYENGNRDLVAEPVWTGSFLRLPYNIKVSDSYGMDVSLVEYIGRSHPVSYYGTQLGVESNWTAEIPRTDTETLYALRRLAIYQGDVYVREPTGSGYWAHVTPSFDRSYDSVTIPVTLKISRVEGGI